MKDIHEIIAEVKKSLRPHEKKALEEILNDGILEKHESGFSEWEKRVRGKLSKSSIQFEERPRDFPIEIDGEIVKYTPDFLLDFDFRERKYVILEVQEELSDEVTKKFRGFLDVYGRIYWLIIVVPDEVLRKWNELWTAQALFHDIWTLDNLPDMINTLEKQRYVSKKKLDKERAMCPKCGKTALGKYEIDELFGYRYEGKKPQSHCKTCRAKKPKTNLVHGDFDVFNAKPMLVCCSLCGRKYKEEKRGEACCPICLRKWRNLD